MNFTIGVDVGTTMTKAVAFDGDGATVWISSEKLPAPLLRAPVP